MAIIKQHDKRSGITYVYESHSYWDPEKKMTRAHRKLIGRLDPETGEIIATDGRMRKPKDEKKEEVIDYEKRCAQLEKKCRAQEELIAAMRKQIAELEKGAKV